MKYFLKFPQFASGLQKHLRKALPSSCHLGQDRSKHLETENPWGIAWHLYFPLQRNVGRGDTQSKGAVPVRIYTHDPSGERNPTPWSKHLSSALG